jgi:Stress responsive A/B Barrel Domain
MRKSILIGLVAAVAAVACFGVLRPGASEAGKKGGTMLSHDVYFTLKDSSAKAKQELVDACHKYLRKHPGEVFFAVGTRAEEYTRDVNDKDFDVALHIVFSDNAAHDKYQDAERHKQFIAEQKANWKSVRVFDSLVTQ